MTSPTHGVDSEVGRLRTVMLHRPGPELQRLTPRNNDKLLFDGILSGKDGFETYDVGHGHRIPLGDNSTTDPVDGKDVALTIDRDVQWYTQRVLRQTVEDAGGTGFVTGYAAPEAATEFLDTLSQETETLAGSGPSEEEKALIEEAFADFEGAAMSLRFADEGVELKVSAAGLVQEDLSAALSEGDTGITELPASTSTLRVRRSRGSGPLVSGA